jgi:hypothetical protein
MNGFHPLGEQKVNELFEAIQLGYEAPHGEFELKK